MKKFFSSFSIITFCLGLLALVFGFINFSLANQGNQNQIIDHENNGGGAVVAGFNQDAQNPNCLDNFQSWPNSDRFTTSSQWSLAGLPVPPVGWHGVEGYFNRDRVMSQFLDINGDGLQDYIYSFRYPEVNNNLKMNVLSDCVMLNTGSGWNPVYKCQVTYENGAAHYYGDCALIN